MLILLCVICYILGFLTYIQGDEYDIIFQIYIALGMPLIKVYFSILVLFTLLSYQGSTLVAYLVDLPIPTSHFVDSHVCK
jgi:hypothetical protein